MLFSVDLLSTLVLGGIALVAISVITLLALWVREYVKGELW